MAENLFISSERLEEIRNSMKFSGKMCFNIILKVTKNQGSALSIEDTFFEKPQGVNLTPPRHFRVNLEKIIFKPKNETETIYFTNDRL